MIPKKIRPYTNEIVGYSAAVIGLAMVTTAVFGDDLNRSALYINGLYTMVGAGMLVGIGQGSRTSRNQNPSDLETTINNQPQGIKE